MSDERVAAPALQLCRIALRPRGPLESFDLAVRVARDWWRPLGALAALTLVPAWVFCTLVSWAAGHHLVVLLLPLALGPLIGAPFTVLGGRLLFAERVRAREVAADLRARAGAFFALLAGQAATLTCLLVWPFVAVPTVFATECALLERVAPARALRRSWRLASGSGSGALGGTIGRWILLAWSAVVAEASAMALASVFQVTLPTPSALEGLATPWIIAGILASHPVWALWRLLLYVDARTRVEGWDLQVGLRAAGLAR